MSAIFKIGYTFKQQALQWASGFKSFTFLNYTNTGIHYSGYSPFPCLLAAGRKAHLTVNSDKGFNDLRCFHEKHKAWMFGYLGYDLKNETENLQSLNPDKTSFPDLHFFIPEYLFRFENDTVEITGPDAEKIFHEIASLPLPSPSSQVVKIIKQNQDKSDYIDHVTRLQEHLLKGDIYEVNFCLEFFSENASIDPVEVFLKLCDYNPMPYSFLLRDEERYIISASPERFLKKEGNKLIAQPMKGTSRRSLSQEEDELLKAHLRTSEKEQAENMMIVDLMRNDMAKSSRTGSVVVEELFGVYSLSHVHQMVSTITSRLREDVLWIDAIRNAFPMGSMTGAPKIRAMQLIELYEQSKRGVFSGAAGFITPEGDFDLNVIIRSILYNRSSGYLSFHAGSAITFDSDPEKEYEECLLKTAAIRKILRGMTSNE